MPDVLNLSVSEYFL